MKSGGNKGIRGRKNRRKRESLCSMTIKEKTSVANHQEASRNLLKAGSFVASAILHCLQRIVAVLCTYPPANNELDLHESKPLLIIFAKERLLHAQAFVLSWKCVVFRISLFHHSK